MLFVSNYLKPWINSCTECMLGEVIDRAVQQFPISFSNNTTAKIYFFVIVNKELLFNDEFQINFIGENSKKRKESSVYTFNELKKFWKNKIDELAISLGTEVLFIMQGIAHTPETPQDPWHIPNVFSTRDCIGLKPHGSNSSSGGGMGLPNDPLQIQNMVNKILSNYGVPEDKIPKVN